MDACRRGGGQPRPRSTVVAPCPTSSGRSWESSQASRKAALALAWGAHRSCPPRQGRAGSFSRSRGQLVSAPPHSLPAQSSFHHGSWARALLCMHEHTNEASVFTFKTYSCPEVVCALAQCCSTLSPPAALPSKVEQEAQATVASEEGREHSLLPGEGAGGAAEGPAPGK